MPATISTPTRGLIQATAARAIPFPTQQRAAAVDVVANYLQMLRGWAETRYAVAGNGAGAVAVGDRNSYIYARLGSASGEVIEAKLINLLDPDDGDALLVRRETPGGAGGWLVLDVFAEGRTRVCGCYPLPADIVSWWSGDDTPDDLLGLNDGTLMNGAGYGTGMVNNAFSFSRASDEHVFVGDSASLQIAGSLTLDAWVYPVSVPEKSVTVPAEAWSQPYAIITKWGQDETKDSYGLWLHSTDGSTIRLLGALGHYGSPDAGFSGYGEVAVNEWSFVAMTYNAATDENLLYVNGEVVSSRTQPGGTTTSDLDVLIGREDSPLPRNFDGLIDEVEIFDRALTADEIRGIYLAGAFGKCRDELP